MKLVLLTNSWILLHHCLLLFFIFCFLFDYYLILACIFFIICLLNVSFRSALVSCLNTAFYTTRINVYVLHILHITLSNKFVCISWKLYHALLLSYFYTKSTQSRMHVKSSIFQTRILYQIFTSGRGQSFNIFLRDTTTGINYFKFITLFAR